LKKTVLSTLGAPKVSWFSTSPAFIFEDIKPKDLVCHFSGWPLTLEVRWYKDDKIIRNGTEGIYHSEVEREKMERKICLPDLLFLWDVKSCKDSISAVRKTRFQAGGPLKNYNIYISVSRNPNPLIILHTAAEPAVRSAVKILVS